jgi:hypothetical protein
VNDLQIVLIMAACSIAFGLYYLLCDRVSR